MAKVVTADDRGVKEAEEVLRAGGVVGFPSDTAYGLATASAFRLSMASDSPR